MQVLYICIYVYIQLIAHYGNQVIMTSLSKGGRWEQRITQFSLQKCKFSSRWQHILNDFILQGSQPGDTDLLYSAVCRRNRSIFCLKVWYLNSISNFLSFQFFFKNKIKYSLIYTPPARMSHSDLDSCSDMYTCSNNDRLIDVRDTRRKKI